VLLKTVCRIRPYWDRHWAQVDPKRNGRWKMRKDVGLVRFTRGVAYRSAKIGVLGFSRAAYGGGDEHAF